jgi:serine protease Do
MTNAKRVLAGGALMFATACAGPAANPVPPASMELPAARREIPPPIDTITATGLSAAFRAAAGHALPSVVQIKVLSRVDVSRLNLPEDHPGGVQGLVRGTGSGFILDAEGHVLTNNHVITNAERVIVVLSDGRDWEAGIVGFDINTDVAVLRVDPQRTGPLQPAEFGDSDALRIGDWVLALGNPLDLAFTVTTGIVSAKGRNINILRNTANTQLESFIQTDAAINPGNSGGPLVDLFGRVVGVNTAIQTQNGLFGGAGFAIPINLARKVADDLIRYGVAHRPRLGVVIQDVTAADAEVYRLPVLTGVEIASVTPGLPAAKAGLRMGDVVLSVNDIPVESVTDLQARIARLQPGERVTLGLIRYGEALEISVEPAEFETEPRPARAPRSTDRPRLGFSARLVSAGEARDLKLDPKPTVIIDELDPFGPAAEAQVLVDVALLEINGTAIATIEDIERIARTLEPGQVVSVVIKGRSGPGSPAAPTVYNYRIW